jgi:protein O-mannosyl-transferase
MVDAGPGVGRTDARDSASEPAVTTGQALSALLMAGATLLAYLPAARGGYVWDDDLHLLDNPVLKPGGLVRSWVPGTYINYWPLTFSTYWLEDKLWGVAHPIGFHVINILLHVACALLIWQVLRHVLRVRANGPPSGWAPLLGAAVFALWLYLRHERSGQWPSYALAIGVFALSTLAKGMGVTLPAVLLALAWWQRDRIDWRDVRRVLPFLVIGVLMACVEVLMQNEGPRLEVPRTDSALSRVAAAGWCVWFYLEKLIWPLNLSFVYPRWTVDGSKLLSFVPDALLLGLLTAAWFNRRAWGRGVFMVLACYVTLLLPVLGFVNIYFMRYSLVADHWQYAAMIVPAAGLGACLASAGRGGIPRVMVAATTLTMLVGLGALTYRQAGVYRDAETLWQDVLKHNPDSWMAHHNLGNWLANRGRAQEAAVHYEATVRLKSDDTQAYNNLGGVLSRMGRFTEAIASFERALAIDGRYALARQNVIPVYKTLGKQLLVDRRDYETARRYYLRVTQLAPDDVEAHYGLGVALLETGDVPQAVKQLQTAATLEPTFLPAHDLLARTLATRPPIDGGNPDRAVNAALQACALTAYLDASRLDTLAMAYASTGRFASAVATEERALELVGRSGPVDQIAALRAHRSLFRAAKPYREGVQSAR